MFCKNCGKEIADNAKFCEHCGAQLEVAEPIENDENQGGMGCSGRLLLIALALFLLGCTFQACGALLAIF